MKKSIKILLGVVSVVALAVFTLFAQPLAVSTDSLIINTWALLTATTANVGTLNVGTLVITNGVTGDVTVSGAVTGAQGGIFPGGLVVGGSTIGSILSASATVDIGSTATNVISTSNITVAGAGTNSTVAFNIVTPNTNFTYGAVVSATNTVTIRAANISIATVDPAATSVRVTVFNY